MVGPGWAGSAVPPSIAFLFNEQTIKSPPRLKLLSFWKLNFNCHFAVLVAAAIIDQCLMAQLVRECFVFLSLSHGVPAVVIYCPCDNL